MARKSNKSGQWAKQHLKDPYVKKANGEGYRSRAVYKLQEIDRQDKLIKPGMTIVDLGCAPGGWCQYIAREYQQTCRLIGIDLLPTDPLDGMCFIQGDFQDEKVLAELDAHLTGKSIDLVLSDMAPNITGIRSADEANFEELLGSILTFCEARLKQNGQLLTKLFEGNSAHLFRRDVKQYFKSGVVRKPVASRPQSREYYFLARQKKA